MAFNFFTLNNEYRMHLRCGFSDKMCTFYLHREHCPETITYVIGETSDGYDILDFV
jgi:hypothetical protein